VTATAIVATVILDGREGSRMRVAVAGGTGVVGSHTVSALRRAGHEPVVLARSQGVDVVTGRGLDAALSGADAVIDVTNVVTVRRHEATEFFTAATRRLLDVGRRAGVRHHVVLSIVGVERVGIGYYRAKLEQERLVQESDRPFTVLRATQFHEFPGQLLARMRGPVAFLPRMRIRPVAAVEVAERLSAIAAGNPLGAGPEVAGPEVHDVVDLARRVEAGQPKPRRVVALPVVGKAARAVAGEALLPSANATVGKITFDDWLTAEHR
jgi:uncharacterized protein YbjT (DUF2867 family)